MKYTEQELAERHNDVSMIAYLISNIDIKEELYPCDGHNHCCFYGEWDCTQCILANKIFEYYKNKKI